MTRWISSLFLLSVLVLLTGALPSSKKDSDAVALQCLATVDSLLALDHSEEAVAVATSCRKDFVDDPHWNYQFDHRLAIAWLRTGQPDLALPLLEARVISYPGQAQAHRNLGACLLALGRRGRAMSEYQQVVELEPRSSNARLEYGQILLDFRIYKEAEKEILTAANLCGDCPEVQPVLARYYQATDQPAKAAPHWRAMWLVSGNPVARRNLLVALLASAQDQQVMDLILENPIFEIPQEELQQLVAAEGRLGQSQQSLFFVDLIYQDNAPRVMPDAVAGDHTFWGQVSQNLLMAEHYSEALLAVDKAISLAKDNVVYLNNRVVLLQELQRFEEAERQWEILLLLDPSLKGN